MRAFTKSGLIRLSLAGLIVNFWHSSDCLGKRKRCRCRAVIHLSVLAFLIEFLASSWAAEEILPTGTNGESHARDLPTRSNSEGYVPPSAQGMGSSKLFTQPARGVDSTQSSFQTGNPGIQSDEQVNIVQILVVGSDNNLIEHRENLMAQKGQTMIGILTAGAMVGAAFVTASGAILAAIILRKKRTF